MMTKIVKLNIDKSVTGVAGFPYGKKIFEEQVKNQLTDTDYDNGIEIVFPDKIERVTSSFVQGFFSDLIDKHGYYGVKKSITVRSSSQKLSDSIFDVLE